MFSYYRNHLSNLLDHFEDFSTYKTMVVKILLPNSLETGSENCQKFLEMNFNLCVTDARGDKKKIPAFNKLSFISQI